MDIAEQLKLKRAEILRLAEKHGAKNIRIFGSVARGEAERESDLDILVEMGEDHTPFFPGGLLADLEELLGCKVEAVTENALHWYIRERVLKEAIPL